MLWEAEPDYCNDYGWNHADDNDPQLPDPDIVIDRKLLAGYEAEQFERENYDPYSGKDIDL